MVAVATALTWGLPVTASAQQCADLVKQKAIAKPLIVDGRTDTVIFAVR